jgi:hypothetical protein
VHKTDNQQDLADHCGTAATLEIGMLNQDGSSTPGIVVELSYGGVRLKFSDTADIVLPIGYDIPLQLQSNMLDEPIVVSATIVDRFDKSNCREYGFKFHDPESLRFQLPPALQDHFNKRKVYRVHPGPDAPVGIWLTNVEGDAVPGQLVDVSTSGAGVRVSRVLEIGFSRLTQVAVVLHFPDMPNAHNVKCKIRNRSLVEETIHYGLEFCVSELNASPATRQIIIDYVIRRQSEISQAEQGFSRIFT